MCTRKLLAWNWSHTEKADNKRIAAQTPTAGVYEEKDIAYIDDGNRYHLLDIEYPQGTTEPLPTVIDIHGGGWMYGTKELNRNYTLYLASRGFTVVTINYRLVPETDLWGQISDVFAALTWVAEHNGQYNIDTDRLFVTGDSAGGHLTMLVGYLMNNRVLADKFGVPSGFLNIRAVGTVCPATEFSGMARGYKPVFTTYMKMVLGKDFRTNPLTPLVSVSGLRSFGGFPPAYIITSAQDFIRSGGIALRDALAECNSPHVFDYSEKGENYPLTHVYCVIHPEYEESIRANNAMLDYFLAQL